MYYNITNFTIITENLIQFSKNKSESKYAEDDYGLYANFQMPTGSTVSYHMLAYGERVI